MVRKYGKLVRDKIPEIIKAEGEEPVIRVLSGDEFIQAVEAKMDEELKEYHEAPSLEELADLATVIFAVAEARGHSIDELMSAVAAKGDERGLFDRRLWLEEVHDGR